MNGNQLNLATASLVQTSRNSLEIQLFTGEEIGKGLELWQQLESRLDSVPLTASRAWTEIWLKHYADIVSPTVVIGRDQQGVKAACLLTMSTQQKLGPCQIRSLHLGTAGEGHGQSVCVEYNDFLAELGSREQFSNQLTSLVLSRSDWDQFHLDGICSSEEFCWPVWSEESQLVNGLSTNMRSRESRYFDLKQVRQTQVDILDQLGKSTKSNLKRRLKQAGETVVEWAEDLTQGLEIFQELVELHQARWNSAGEPGAFASQRFYRFQQELILRLLPENRVVLARIRSQGKTVGCLYLLNDRNRLLDYVSGLISFEEFPSPGLISHYLCMQQALQRGYDAYDFLVGEKRHKENLGKSSQQLQWIVYERPQWKYKLRNLAIIAKRFAKKLVNKP